MSSINRKLKHLVNKRQENSKLHSTRTPQRNNAPNNMPERSSHRKTEDWDMRMEGFHGLDWEEEQKTKAASNSNSQVDIDWTSDPEEIEPDLATVVQDDEADVIPPSQSDDVPCKHPSHPKSSGKLPDKSKKKRKPNEAQSVNHSKRPRPVFYTNKGKEISKPDATLYSADGDYESEGIESPMPSQPSPKQASPEADIAEQEAEIIAPSLSLSPTQSPRRPGSEWLKQVGLATPPPRDMEGDQEEGGGLDALKLVESGKKKQKYLKDGLAERLQKIIAREKSAFTMWRHKKSVQASDKCLKIEVMSHTKTASIIKTTCQCLHAPTGRTIKAGDSLQVLFNTSYIERVEDGDVIAVHPPWQMLQLSSGQTAVLCTQYSQLENRKPASTNTTWSRRFWAKWKCPCSQDESIDPTSCPAHTEPFTVTTEVTPRPSSSSKLPVTSGSPQQSSSQCHLLTVSDQVSQDGKQGILCAIERQGGYTADRVAFTAMVQAVFTRRSDTVKRSLSQLSPRRMSTLKSSAACSVCLLLQDHKGDLCQLQLPDPLLTHPCWQEVISSGRGHTYKLTGLRVVRRLTQARHEALFSVLHSVWSVDAASRASESQQSDRDGSQPCGPPQPPAFCYLLTATSGDSNAVKVNTNTLISPHSPAMSPLHSALEKNLMGCARRCFAARVYFYERDDNNNLKKLHLYDKSIASGQDSPLLVNISSAAHLDQQVTECIVNCRLLVFIHVLQQNDELLLDEYSELTPGTDTPAPVVDIPLPTSHLYTLPDLTDDTIDGCLVSLTGTVSNVDESTAFSWLVCDVCSSDNLQQNTRSELYCEMCERIVTSPQTRMKLDVFLQSPFTYQPVRVALLQSAIEKLLPEEDDDEEGYELSSVLGQTVGPISCLLLAQNPKPHLQQVTVKF